MEWVIIAAVFAAAGYMIYRNSKDKKGGSYRGNDGNDQQR